MTLKSGVGVFLLSAGMSAFAASAAEPVFTAPPDYVENAPEGDMQCPHGMRSMLTHREFRQFALRNEVWPQSDDVDLSSASWSAGKTLNRPSPAEFRPDGRRPRGFKAEARVLVDGNGGVLDQIISCTNRPEYNTALLEYLSGFEFEPSRYKGRGLNTILKVSFDY